MAKTAAVLHVAISHDRFGHSTAGVWSAMIAPGLGIRIRGTYTNCYGGPKTFDRTFAIGDTVEYNSFNLSYTGKITAIGAKTVTIVDGSTRTRLDLARFTEKNWDFDIAKSEKRNAEWMD